MRGQSDGLIGSTRTYMLPTYVIIMPLLIQSVFSADAGSNGTFIVAVQFSQQHPVTLKGIGFSTDTGDQIQQQEEALLNVVPVATSYFNLVGTISLGEQFFQVFFESASPNLWVFGKEYKSSFGIKSYNLYDENKSGTFTRRTQGEKKIVKLKYPESTVYGRPGFETLNIGDDLVLDGVPFVIAGKTRGQLSQFIVHDGSFGLSYERETEDGTILSPFARMVRKGVLRQNMFSVHLHDLNSRRNMKGEIMFGGWDESQYTGTPHFVKVITGPDNPTGKWMVALGSVHFTEAGDKHSIKNGVRGEEVKGWWCANAEVEWPEIILPSILLDSLEEGNGAKLLLQALDKKKDRSYYNNRIPCKSRKHLPVLSIGMGGKLVTLRGHDYTSGQTSWVDDKGKAWCDLLISFSSDSEKITRLENVRRRRDGRNTGCIDVIKLGAPFFKKYYTMFVDNGVEEQEGRSDGRGGGGGGGGGGR